MAPGRERHRARESYSAPAARQLICWGSPPWQAVPCPRSTIARRARHCRLRRREDTGLGEVIHPAVSRRPDLSGIATLEDPLDAFAARALLAQASERSLDARFDERVPQSAYEVVLTPQGELRWLETRGDRVVRHAQEPDTGVVKRSMGWLFSLLPLEPLL